MRILLIEDEKQIASFIKRGLKEDGFAVDVSYDGEDGLFMIKEHDYDLIVMDILLPVKDGITIVKEMRKDGIRTPVLMLTSKGLVENKVQGLNAGADDYLAKPFSFEEFLARIHALLRRQTGSPSNQLTVGDLQLNRLTHEAARDGKKIELTTKEYALLEYLMLHAGQVVTRTMISEHVWDERFDSFSNVIDVYINYLRNKIDKGREFKLIHSLRSKGYILRSK